MSLRTSFVIVLMWAAACAPDTAADRGPSPCSTGPAYAPGTRFPELGLDPAQNPTCTPRCDYDRSALPRPNGQFHLEAVPSGACTVEGERCVMQVDMGCSTDGVRCDCTRGEWSCGVTMHGGGVCGGDAAAVLENDRDRHAVESFVARSTCREFLPTRAEISVSRDGVQIRNSPSA